MNISLHVQLCSRRKQFIQSDVYGPYLHTSIHICVAFFFCIKSFAEEAELQMRIVDIFCRL